MELQASEQNVSQIFRHHRGRILITYVLFNLENILRLLQPFFIGLAINDLVSTPIRYRGLTCLAVQHLLHLGVGTARRMYDTRAFTHIYTELVTPLIVNQRQNDIDVSKVSARSVLSREYVDFFEQHIPMMIRAAYSVVGSLLMLGWYDWRLVPACLLLLIPATFLNRLYSRKTYQLSQQLHTVMENEVDVIERGEEDPVRRHFQLLASWRIRLSDAEAINFGFMELCILTMILATLVMICQPGTQAGDLFAVFRYLMMFIMGMDAIPRVVLQLSRLKEIGTRMPSDFRRGQTGVINKKRNPNCD